MIEWTLPWPPASNHNVKHANGAHYLSSQHKQFRIDVHYLLMQAKAIKMHGPLAVKIQAFPPDRRRRDIDNLIKPILDALQHAGLYEDDNQIGHIEIKRCEVSPKNGRVFVEVSTL